MKIPRQSNRGQALTEYIIGGGLVLLVSIASLSMLGGNLDKYFNTMANSPAGDAPKVAGITSSTTSTVKVPIALAPSTSANLPSDKRPLSMPETQGSYGNLVSVMGVNGSSSLVADQITALAHKLLDEGKITEAQANLFYNLANQGHSMASIEKIIEDGIHTHTDPVMYNGKSVWVGELTQELGWRGPAGSQKTIDDMPPGNESPQMLSLLNAYKALAASGALSSPGTQELTMKLTTDIANMSEAMEDTVAKTSTTLTAAAMDAELGSRLSDQKSSIICTQGKGADSGTHCQ